MFLSTYIVTYRQKGFYAMRDVTYPTLEPVHPVTNAWTSGSLTATPSHYSTDDVTEPTLEPVHPVVNAWTSGSMTATPSHYSTGSVR